MNKTSRLRKFIDGNPITRVLVVRILRLLAKHRTCVFCEIVRGESPRGFIYQDDLVTAFRDVHPAVSTHILIVTNRHIESINNLQTEDAAACGHMFNIARKLAESEKIQDCGYQLVVNTGLHAGQTVFHLHMHLKSLD